jgi:hypothetical protein
MEVHHHPNLHHQSKPWKEYLLEFLMIFLAVTLGFFAESIREQLTDNTKEKEFISAMIQDAKTDISNIRRMIELNNARALHLDSLAELCFNYDASPHTDQEIYRLYRRAIIHPDFVSPTERTLLQLKNSGGMRLIKSKAAVDSIIVYDDMAKKLSDQQAYYERYQNESIQIAFKLLNFQQYLVGLSGHLAKAGEHYDAPALLIKDKLRLIEFGNSITIYKGVVSFYVVRLKEMNDHAISLINTLQKEYHLESD